MKAYLHGITTVLPDRQQSNEELAEGVPGWSADKIRLKTGITGRYIAAEGETAGDLCARAAEKFFALRPETRAQIDTVIVCTQSPDYLLPSTACLLQNRLGLSTRCAAFDLPLACSGYTYSLWLARSLIVSESATNVLVLAGDTYSRYCNPKELATASLFGDGATATLISAQADQAWAEVGPSVLGSDGRGEKNLLIRAGGSRQPEPVEEHDRYLYMNGAEVAAFAVSTVKPVINELLTRTQRDWADIDHFVFHQANPSMVQRLVAAYRLPPEKVPIDLADVGNTCSATIPMTMERCWNAGRFHAGQQLVLMGFGVGYSWAATLLNWLREPAA